MLVRLLFKVSLNNSASRLICTGQKYSLMHFFSVNILNHVWFCHWDEYSRRNILVHFRRRKLFLIFLILIDSVKRMKYYVIFFIIFIVNRVLLRTLVLSRSFLVPIWFFVHIYFSLLLVSFSFLVRYLFRIIVDMHYIILYLPLFIIEFSSSKSSMKLTFPNIIIFISYINKL